MAIQVDNCTEILSHHTKSTWLLRHVMTSFNLRRMAPCLVVVIITYTAIGTLYCNCVYFCLHFPSCTMHLQLSFMQSTAVTIELMYAFVKITLFANQKSSLHYIMFDDLWFLWLCRMFRNNLVNVTILGRIYWVQNVIWFHLQIVPATFFFPIITQRAVYINVLGFSCEVSAIFVRFWIFMANSSKNLQYKMSRSCVQGEGSYSYGWTHRQRET